MGRWQPGARERLEQAALDLFLEQGFTETTVPQITARAGLTTRSASETAEATRAWDDAQGRPPLEVGPSRAQEAALLADLNRRR